MKHAGAALSLLLLALLMSTAVAKPRFQAEIPNVVPGSPGVGHVSPNGGGALNAFGKDFREAGYVWTPALCRKDSDGDGATNGQELGDPQCTWKKGDPRPAGAITHPGLASSAPRPIAG